MLFLQFAWTGKHSLFSTSGCIRTRSGTLFRVNWNPVSSCVLTQGQMPGNLKQVPMCLSGSLLLKGSLRKGLASDSFHTPSSTTSCSYFGRVTMPPLLQEWSAEPFQPARVHVYSFQFLWHSFLWRNKLEIDWRDHQFKGQVIPGCESEKKPL